MGLDLTAVLGELVPLLRYGVLHRADAPPRGLPAEFLRGVREAAGR